MSYTILNIIEPNKTIVALRDFNNSHGFGPYVWSIVAKRYLGADYFQSVADKLWPLCDDTRLPLSWRAALLVSYDRAIVEYSEFKRISILLKDFVQSAGLAGNRDHVSHWSTIADIMYNYETPCFGMCFYGTSLIEDWWHPWDSETDEEKPYNFDDPDAKHFFVGHALDHPEASHD
jgi:hypothetical protein